VTLKRALGTWTFTLTVADGRGGTSTDQVTVVLTSELENPRAPRRPQWSRCVMSHARHAPNVN
jgi:hypothetical protein